MNNSGNLSSNLNKHTLGIFIYYIFFLVCFAVLFFNTQIYVIDSFSINLFLNPVYWKSIFIFIYGVYGCWLILCSYVIGMFNVILCLYNNRTISNKILLFTILLPIYGSLFTYLFFKTDYVGYGIIGSVLGNLMQVMLPDWYRLCFCLFFCIFIFLMVGYNNVLIFFSYGYYFLQKIKFFWFFAKIKQCFLSWLIFFIPKVKKYFLLENEYCIEKLIYDSIYADFYLTLDKHFIVKQDINKNDDNHLLLPYEKIKNNLKKIKTYREEMAESEKKLFLDTIHFFGIQGNFVISYVGPLVNTIIFTPDIKMKLNTIISSIGDIGRVFGRPDLRVVYPIAEFPHSVAFEYANQKKEVLYFIDYAFEEDFLSSHSLEILCGLDTRGNPYYINIQAAPHILLAGTTGSGKSGILNLFIVNIIWKNYPTQVKLILIDPKRTEFFKYENIPHLLFPVAYSFEEIEQIINDVNIIMQERYILFNKFKCTNIDEYNTNQKSQKIPFLVILIDEYGDIVLQSKKLEIKILKLLQMSRAAGIHIIIATQRPSAEIINSVLKSNLPLKIACKVSSSIDSRIILELDGAQKLLGNGDMIILKNSKYERVHGLFVDNTLISTIVKFFL